MYSNNKTNITYYIIVQSLIINSVLKWRVFPLLYLRIIIKYQVINDIFIEIKKKPGTMIKNTETTSHLSSKSKDSINDDFNIVELV